jgi:sulfate permease, SulP family
MPRWLPRVPGSVVALVAGTAAVALAGLPVETIGSKVRRHPVRAARARHSRLPSRPDPAAVAGGPHGGAAGRGREPAVGRGRRLDDGDRHNSNAEIIGQGVANVVVPIFGGIPVTGAIARTATNVKSGARTPVSALVHALTLLAIVLVAAPLAAYIPLATLAAVLFVVAWNMGEWREIGSILRSTSPTRRSGRSRSR